MAWDKAEQWAHRRARWAAHREALVKREAESAETARAIAEADAFLRQMAAAADHLT